MEILITSFTYSPETSGVSIVTQYIAEGLCQLGNDVTVVTRTNGHAYPAAELINGVKVIRFDMGLSLFKKNIGDCNAYIEYVKNAPKDVLIMECVQCHTTDILLPYLSEMKCKVILHSHGGPGVNMNMFGWEGDLLHTIGHTHNWWRFKQYYKHTLPLAAKYIDQVLCLSLCASDLNYMNKTFSKVAILENAAADIFFDEQMYSNDVSQIVGNNTENYILCIANYISNKSQIDVLHAFENMKDKECSLIFIGSNETDYYHKLETEIKNTPGLSNRVKALTHIDRNVFPALIKGAKMFVMASKHEEYPVSLVEAMAVGTPFVSTNAGCARILPGGVVVDNRDDLSLYMDMVNSMPELRSRLGLRGKQYALENNQKSDVVQKLNKIIKSL